MEKTKRFAKFAVPIIVVGVLAALFIDIKLAVILSLSALLLCAYIIYKEKIGQELVIAFLIAVAWTSYYTYTYDSANFMIGKINVFTLVSWTVGLVILREVYERLRKGHRFFKITALYLVVLFSLEAIGYYLLGIRLASDYPSLFGMGIMHAPVLMKIFYMVSGPVYLLITDYLRVK